jgi:hypothetical protein
MKVSTSDQDLISCKNEERVKAQISPVIKEKDTSGRIVISLTPARVFRFMDPIEGSCALVEISKRDFSKMTLYVRYAIWLHEMGHYILNTDSEELADSFSREVYFAQGFPQSEYLYSHINVFEPIRNKDGSVNKNHDQHLAQRLDRAMIDTEQRAQKYF